MGRPASDVENALFAGGGELGVLMRQRDWSTTPLGPVRDWPRALQTAVRIILTSRQPMFVWWGKELINLYNDAYKSIIGGKHPQALGQPAAVVWQEIWDTVGPRAAAALSGKEGTYDEALFLLMERNGYPEETYYTFSYSPMPNDEGYTDGIFCANTDDTQRVIGERQVTLLREVAARTADARTIADACTLSAQSLETNPRDLPFALIYLLDPDRQRVVLAGTANIARGHRAAPEAVALDGVSAWPFAEVVRTNALYLLPDLSPTLGPLPSGAWDRPPTQAVALPIAPSGQTGRAGVLIVGLNPYRLFDDSYKGFLGLVSGQIAAALANAQAYEEERKRAEALAELDRAKTLFFSNVSHEFRTPLTLMLGTIEELQTTLVTNGRTDTSVQLDTAHRNGLRLLKLVNSLLDFSRIEAGRVQAVFDSTDLAAFTAELASVFRSACERAGLRLVVDCPPLPQPVYVDRDMWEKIVLNLLSNAFKFTFAGEIRVALRPSADGASAELTVQDTGIGIPATELPRLFERFHRVEGARGRTQEGTGIGLALVQELVKLHGGQITAESTVDRGSVFTVCLPFGTAHLPHERIGTASTLTSTATRAEAYVEEALRWLPGENAEYKAQGPKSDAFMTLEDTGLRTLDASLPQHLPPNNTHHNNTQHRSRILLADDNADMRDYVRRLLSTHYQVITVTDGQEALATALAAPPDLVLSDVMMPRLDGFELLKALRHAPPTRTVPVLLLTARAGEESRVEGLEAGADDYIVKPFSARELLARVSARLEIARIRAQAEASLRDSELRYRLTARATNDALWDWNLVTDEAHWTNALQSLFGYPEEDVSPNAAWWYEHIHPEDRERVVSGIHALINSGKQVWSDEYRFRRQDGSFAYILDRGYVVHDEAGKPVRMVGAMIDLTARKQAEDTLAHHAEELQQFSYIVSHDLTEPLRTMRNYVQLLAEQLKGKLDGDTEECMAFVTNAAQRMQQMLTDLLAYTRAGQTPELRAVDCEDVLSQVLSALETRITEREAVITHDPLPTVRGDATRLGQVLQNLLGNALKFCEERPPRIHIAAVKENRQWRFSVRDNGIGIDPVQAGRLFQVFQRLHGRNKYPGTGIGLAICKKIVEQHGGRIWVESQPHAGSVFHFTISDS